MLKLKWLLSLPHIRNNNSYGYGSKCKNGIINKLQFEGKFIVVWVRYKLKSKAYVIFNG